MLAIADSASRGAGMSKINVRHTHSSPWKSTRSKMSTTSAAAFSQGNKIMDIEPFVDATVAAEFLCVTRRRVLEMARAAEIPAHPIGGERRTWRFRLSELSECVGSRGIIRQAVPQRCQK